MICYWLTVGLVYYVVMCAGLIVMCSSVSANVYSEQTEYAIDLQEIYTVNVHCSAIILWHIYV